jgi:hypothetical protein
MGAVRWVRFMVPLPIADDNPSFPHVFSGGSTVLTTGGIRTGPD